MTYPTPTSEQEMREIDLIYVIKEMAWQIAALMEQNCGQSGKNWLELFENMVNSLPTKETNQ